MSTSSFGGSSGGGDSECLMGFSWVYACGLCSLCKQYDVALQILDLRFPYNFS